jgi:dihydroxyacetone kinase
VTCICDDPEVFATTALTGFSSVYARTVRAVSGGVVRSTATPEGKVALVIGGGSGHFPAFAGFVGPGLADAAVAGDVFASPSAHFIAHVARLAHRGGGIVLGFGNYAGDVMNFGLAAERLISEGIDVRILAVTDDVASAPASQSNLRRGVAGDLVVFKIAGAAAEAGHNLDAVERVAARANTRTISFGVAFTGCTLPGSAQPLFTVPPQRMGIGLGIHGEPGISEEAILPASRLATMLVDRLVSERPAGASGRVAVVLNGLGCTKYEELFVLWTCIERALKKAGLTLVEPEVGEFVTSLDMAGCSLTLTWLDDELEKFWCAPSDAPVLRRGAIIATEPAPTLSEEEKSAVVFGTASAPSREDGKCVADLIVSIAKALRDFEEELGRIDALAGDGDHGMGMTRGSAAAAEAAEKAVAAGAGAASVLAAAGNAWADRAGGTSGALWGLALRTWSQALSDEVAITPDAVAKGAKAALDAVVRLGSARVGDKTLVDSFDPFVTTLGNEVGKGQPLAAAWRKAADAATAAAEATAQLTPKLGRARSHPARSLGHPDAGAHSLALCARVVAAALESDRRRR